MYVVTISMIWVWAYIIMCIPMGNCRYMKILDKIQCITGTTGGEPKALLVLIMAHFCMLATN